MSRLLFILLFYPLQVVELNSTIDCDSTIRPTLLSMLQRLNDSTWKSASYVVKTTYRDKRPSTGDTVSYISGPGYLDLNGANQRIVVNQTSAVFILKKEKQVLLRRTESRTEAPSQLFQRFLEVVLNRKEGTCTRLGDDVLLVHRSNHSREGDLGDQAVDSVRFVLDTRKSQLSSMTCFLSANTRVREVEYSDVHFTSVKSLDQSKRIDPATLVVDRKGRLNKEFKSYTLTDLRKK